MSETLFNRELITNAAGKKYWTAKLQGRKELHFPPCDVGKIESDGRLEKICPNAEALLVFHAAVLSIQLYKFLDETSLTIGLPGPLPLVIEVDPNASFRELLNSVKQVYLEAKAHQDYPVELLWKTKLFNIGINTEADVSLHFDAKSISGNNDVDAYALLLDYCLQNPDIKIKHIDVLSADLKEFNDTAVPYPSNASIIEIFEQQHPDSIALVYGSKQLTYGELNARANSLAAKLNVKPQSNIAVFQQMGIEYIVSILAILKAGCVYVPISTQDPLARITWLMDEIKAEVILTTKELLDAEVNRQVIYVDEVEDASFVNVKTQHSDIAYIMFTSGSTGNPKGVMVTHRNVLRLVCNTNYVNLSSNTRILLTGAPGFDATTFEIWGSLLNGGTLVLADRDIVLDTELFHRELIRNKINIIWLTSALFNQLVQQSKKNIFEGLSYLLTGGDIASPKHINKVRNENPNLALINGYGPTENTTFSLTMQVEQTYDRSIPIGRPINNSTAYVLDRDLNIKPIGAWGILYVGGDGVSAGYLNSPELTDQKFIQNPFGPGLLYKTDDVVRLLPDLTVEFKGRVDDQVKIRGFRITLGEIEHQLSKHEQIDESVVLVKDDEGDKQLVAYYVAKTEIDPSALKAFLLANLPDYMVPAYYVHLERMPITSNGKVNRKLLPEVQQNIIAYEAPAHEVEEQLAGIWAQLFQMNSSQVSATANFFDLGGHSLKATALMNNINRTFDTHILIKDVFAAPTIREQAALITMSKWASANKEYDNVEGIEIVV